ncbi:hypothetical protein CEXT_798081 [Caerostris extrusa]|uniref:Uncharacterized protein n=1 Tax=Caerostris extrusa TaxID=172846 RepID=A0AAV4V6N6_CAEEX|nr:hypothetical protein CEXT_798081 [Caerostris extrusa]
MHRDWMNFGRGILSPLGVQRAHTLFPSNISSSPRAIHQLVVLGGECKAIMFGAQVTDFGADQEHHGYVKHSEGLC